MREVTVKEMVMIRRVWNLKALVSTYMENLDAVVMLMSMGHDGRENALRSACLASDALDDIKRTLQGLQVFQSDLQS